MSGIGRRITVPEAFAQWRARLDGDAGRDWIGSLPRRVERLIAQWRLTLDDTPPLHGAQALVLLVRREDRPLVLKLSAPQDLTTAEEALGLRAWAGRGAVKLVASEPGALLLERLDPDRSLHALPIREAAAVAGGLIRTLAIAAPDDLPALADIAAGMMRSLPERQRRLGDPVPGRWRFQAISYAGELPAEGRTVLIHADLHYGNVLAGSRSPWLAVDPRPVVGAPEYSVPELVWNRADELHTAAEVRGLLALLVDRAGLDPELARGWVIARSVDYWLWGVERGLTIDPARCERVLAALAPDRFGR